MPYARLINRPYATNLGRQVRIRDVKLLVDSPVIDYMSNRRGLQLATIETPGLPLGFLDLESRGFGAELVNLDEARARYY